MFLLLLAILLQTVENATAAQGDNGPDFAALCTIYKLSLAKAKKPETGSLEDGLKTYKKLRALNFSTATDSFFSTGDGKAQALTADAAADKQKLWAKLIKDQHDEAFEENERTEHGRLASTPARATANKIISQLADQAQPLQVKCSESKKTAEQAGAAAEEKVKHSIYGPDNSEYKSDFFGASKNHNCGAGTNGHERVGLSVANDMFCLCTGNSGTSAQECGGANLGDTADNGKAATPTVWTAIAQRCGAVHTGGELTAARIEAAIAAVEARIGANPNSENGVHAPYVLGKAGAAGCDGSTGNLCVNYKTQLSTGGAGIPWMSRLRDAALLLASATDAEYANRNCAAKLAGMYTAAKAAYTTAALQPQVTEQSTTDHRSTSPSPAKDKEKVCNAAAADKGECGKLKDKGCTYNESKPEGQKCTLSEEGKKEAEKANEDNKEKDGKPDCSSHQDQTSCEKENDGLPASSPRTCGWITFTDKEGTLKEPNCHSSSLLFNNNLALSMAAAFVSFWNFIILRFFAQFNEILRKYAILI
uniref:Variant surface glycoprotein 1125.4301 n=1 Tax=Trypanosoma brucei TaxID=5691 RepID=A0A1J0RAD3_9TRYP|nr:variant surface glycoprotein 1125.4301 [Trypanosoma brucei]